MQENVLWPRRERSSLFMCVHIFLMDEQIHLWMLLLRCRGHLLVCDGIHKRAVSLANRRALMQGLHVVFLEKNMLPNKYHLLLSMFQEFGDELRARRNALLWTISSRALEADSSRMTGGWLFLAKLSQTTGMSGSSLMVWWSSTHFSSTYKREQSLKILGIDNQFLPTSSYITEKLACSLLVCLAHSWCFL